MPFHRRSTNEQTVVACYSVFDRFFPACGMVDFTEGMYGGDRSTPYEVAQLRQFNWVLDMVECGRGARILEIGCGNGTLLAEAARRGASAVGVTISPEQVKRCRHRGLDARLADYRHLGEEYRQRFDAVVLNGPIEHFVQPRDAIDGRADAIYRRMFEIVHRAIDPRSPVRKAINTTIHFARPPQPADLLKSPWSFPRGSDKFHWALLARSFGGFYPVPGQLEACAAGRFRLTHQEDGTQDYHFTSEDWLQRVHACLRSPRIVARLVAETPGLLYHCPRQYATMLACMLWSQSWNWQFRPPDPPTRLLRQTWAWCG